MSLQESKAYFSLPPLESFMYGVTSYLEEGRALGEGHLMQAIDYIDSIKDRSRLSIYYPRLLRIAKSSLANVPDKYPEARKRIELMLLNSSNIPNEALKIAKQSRAIDLLLELTEKDLKGFGENLSASVEAGFVENLEKFIKPPTKVGKGKVFGIEIPDFYSRSIQDYVRGGINRHLFNSREYIEKGIDFHHLIDIFYLDLALNASGVTDNENLADRAFDQALLDISAPYSEKGKGYFRNSISKFIKTNFDQGLITPPPIGETLKKIMSKFSKIDFKSADSDYYYDVIHKTLLFHGSDVAKAIRTNPVWTRSFMPGSYIRYREIFEDLKKRFGTNVENILELGSSNFGAAVSLQKYFPESKVLGCDLDPEKEILSKLNEEALDKFRLGKLSYLQWNILYGLVYKLSEVSQLMEGKRFDIVTLLNSAYPHLESTTNSYLGRVAAIEAGIKLADKAFVIAGGEGLNQAYNAENPSLEKPDTQGNGWIFLKNEADGLDTKGILFT